MTSQVRYQWLVRGFVGTSAALLLVLSSRMPLIRSLGTQLFSVISSPFLRTGITINESGEVFFASKRALINELRDLEERQKSLLRIAIEAETTRRDLDEARTLIEYRERSTLTGLTAKVLIRTIHNGEEELIINRGSSDGIQANDPVLASDGSLIGVVREALPTVSRVTLITNTQSLVGATVSKRDATVGIIRGQAESLLRFEFIPQSAHLVEGDLVITSGIDPNIPSDLAIGQVNRINRDPNAAFFDALIEPLADLENIRLVNVLLTHAL